MAELERVKTIFEADAADYIRTTDRMKRETKGFEDQVQRTTRKSEQHLRQFSQRAKTALATFLSVAAVQQFGRAITRTIGQVDQLGKTATKLNIGVEALQEFRFAAERSGVAVRTFDMAFQRFSRRAAEAAAGTGEAKDTLAELGIQLTDSNGLLRDTEVLFTEVADAMANVEDQNSLLRIAFKLFDSEGAALVNMLRNGSAALEDMRQEARDLGIVLSTDLVRDAEKMQDQLTRVISSLNALWAKFVINFGQGLDILFDTMPDTVEEQIADRIDELRDVQDSIRRGVMTPGVMEGPTDTASVEEDLTNLRRREEQLQQEIRTLEELRQARERANNFDPTLPSTGGGGLGGGGSSEAEERKKNLVDVLELIEEEINAVEREIAVIGKSTAERARFLALLRAEAFARENNIELGKEEREDMAVFLNDLENAIQRLEKKREAEEEAREAAEDHQSALDGVGSALVRTAVNARDLESALNGLQSILLSVIQNMITSNLSGPLNSLLGGLGGVFGGGGGGGSFGAGSASAGSFFPLTSAKGNVFSAGERVPFRKGGVVSRPTLFPMAKGAVGLMGEEDEEAVMPLARSRDGKLGVRSQGGGSGAHVEVNVHAPPGSEVREERSGGPDRERIDVFIDQAVSRNLRPGTSTFKSLRAVFGVDQQTRRR